MASQGVAAVAAAAGQVADAKLGKSASKTITDTIVGEHEHTIVGYSLVKGIGDGEPIASERFTVGGHEWVLLFYPDGKRSSTSEGQPPPAPAQANYPAAAPAANAAAPGNGGAPAAAAGPARVPADHNPPLPARALPAPNPPQAAGAAGNAAGAGGMVPFAQPAGAVQPPAMPQQQGIAAAAVAAAQQQQQARRDQAQNDYAALFVALIGEGENPQGVVHTNDGKVVRAFHKFTLVDQLGQGRDLTKGRRREQGAVKISCARQDPNARNCHGYRKFVKRSVLENPQNGYLVNDTIVIRYTIELVVSTGGALARSNSSGTANKQPLPSITVPQPTIGQDMSALLDTGADSDVVFKVEGESMRAHRIVLQARSQVFCALLNAPMREAKEGIVEIDDVRAPVFKALLHFVYADSLPAEFDGGNLDVALAQHLLVAADRFQLTRLRRICEQRLCETVEVDTVATTLALAEQNHAQELKRVCLEFVSRNLANVMESEGYQHMVQSCPQLQDELLKTIATNKEDTAVANVPGRHRSSRHHAHVRALPPAAAAGAVVAVAAAAAAEELRAHVRGAVDEGDENARRVRPRRE